MSTSGRAADTCDLPALRAYLLAHAIPGVDEVAELADGSTVHRRLVQVPEGDVRLDVTLSPGEVGVPLTRVDGRADAVAPARAAARRWLGLDLDPRPAASALADDPVLGPLVRARPWLRVPGAANPFEGAVFVVLGQHVSLAAARAFAGRLVAAHGGFPTAETLADSDPAALQEVVGVTGARARAIVALAREVAGGTLPLGREQLLALPGVGPWTADLIAMRCLRDPDVFLPGDLVLRTALGGVTAAQADRLARAWSPHRSLAVLHLWTHHALLPPG